MNESDARTDNDFLIEKTHLWASGCGVVTHPQLDQGSCLLLPASCLPLAGLTTVVGRHIIGPLI